MAPAARNQSKRQNFELARGVNAFSARSLANSNGRYRHAQKKESKKVKEPVKQKSKWYPVEFVRKPLKSAKTLRNSRKVAVLRKSITPGTVLILLSGRFRGKRVVFLKQLASGTLLVTGPYTINGVPLRRVNQAYVIATSTKLDISDIELPAIDDSYFAREKTSKTSKEEQFFAEQSATSKVSEKRKQDQRVVDSALMKKIVKEEALKSYLRARFTLSKKDCVHEMKF